MNTPPSSTWHFKVKNQPQVCDQHPALIGLVRLQTIGSYDVMTTDLQLHFIFKMPGTWSKNVPLSSGQASAVFSHKLTLCAWVTACRMSDHMLHEWPHVAWVTTCRMSDCMSHGWPHTAWVTSCRMSDHMSHELPHVAWVTACRMSYRMSHEWPHVARVTTCRMSDCNWQKKAFHPLHCGYLV